MLFESRTVLQIKVRIGLGALPRTSLGWRYRATSNKHYIMVTAERDASQVPRDGGRDGDEWGKLAKIAKIGQIITSTEPQTTYALLRTSSALRVTRPRPTAHALRVTFGPFLAVR